jgi:hypothetical protein
VEGGHRAKPTWPVTPRPARPGNWLGPSAVTKAALGG